MFHTLKRTWPINDAYNFEQSFIYHTAEHVDCAFRGRTDFKHQVS